MKNKIITPEEFKLQMEEIYDGNSEYGNNTYDCHIAADSLMGELLRQLGYGEGAAIFNASPRWYG